MSNFFSKKQLTKIKQLKILVSKRVPDIKSVIALKLSLY